MPLRWEATGTTGELFPVLDADLALTGDGGGQTRIASTARTGRPSGGPGRRWTGPCSRRLAAGTIQSLVESVANAVADPAPGRKADERPAARWGRCPKRENPDRSRALGSAQEA